MDSCSYLYPIALGLIVIDKHLFFLNFLLKIELLEAVSILFLNPVLYQLCFDYYKICRYHLFFKLFITKYKLNIFI